MNRMPTKQPWSPFKAASLYQQGLIDFEEGRYAAAIERLAAIPERSLPGTLARFYLGQAHHRFGVAELRAGNFKNAAEHLSAARRINPDSSGLSKFLAAAYVGDQRFDLAADELERGRRGDRPLAGVTDSDVDITSTVIHDDAIRLAYVLVKDGQLDRAVASLESAIETSPWRAELHQHLGLILAAHEQYETARGHLARAAGLAPLHFDILMNYALVLGALGLPREALAPLKTCQKLRSNDAHVAWMLAVACDAAGVHAAIGAATVEPVGAVRTDEDLDALGELVASQPDFVEAFLRLPESPIDTDVFAMLARTLEKALERQPDYADLHHHCSRVYERLGNTDAAIDAASRAVRINPRYVQALIQLGRLYKQTDRRDEAVDRLTDAIAAGGDYPDVHYLLGRLYQDRGEPAAALTEYRRALELNGNYDVARTAMQELVTV